MIKKRTIVIISILILLVGFLITFSYNMEKEIKKADGILLKASDFTNGEHDLSVRLFSLQDPKNESFSTVVGGDRLMSIPGNSFHILIFRLNTQAITLYFNGEYIGSYGDVVSGQSHIYNSIISFDIPKEKILEVNSLKISTYSLYMVGLENNPIGIVDSHSARQIIENVTFRTQGLTYIGIGIFLLGIVITLMMIFLSQKKNVGFLYFLVAISFLSIYSLDFMVFSHMSISYLFFKKIVIFSLFACVFFLGLSFSNMFKSKTSWIFSTFLFCCITLAILFTKDMITFKRIYDFFIPMIALNFIVWIVISSVNLHKKDEAIIFLCSYTNMLILAAADSIALIVRGGTVSISISTHVLVFSFILIAVLYLEINRRNLAIEHETKQRSHFYNQAITDTLTGAFNLSHTSKLLAAESQTYTLVMMDIDNFKMINDNNGHQCGDYILKYLVKKMRDEFRDTDIIGRYGGDEFIIILRGCSEKNAFDIMNRFRMHIDHDKIAFGTQTIKITVSIGIHHCDNPDCDTSIVIKSADEALYRAKQNGKNQVSI